MKMFTKLLSLRNLLSLLLLVSLIGCSAPSQNYPSLPPAPSTLDSPPDDLVRKGDVLQIRLSGVPVEDQGIYEQTVNEDGKVSMPHIGSLQAAGITTVQLKSAIEKAYRDRRIYSNPNISIVTQQNRFISVIGEVRNPQRVPYTKDLTAWGAIAACNGFTDYAEKRRVRLLRENQVFEFDADAIPTDPSKDILLQPDDKIEVRRRIF